MENTLAKCGCDCQNCPSFKENLKTADERQCCSKGWEKHLGFKLSPEKLRACDGCSLPDRDRKNYYLNCLVRKCAQINQVDHCGYCKEFPCQELMEVHSLQLIPDRQAFILKHGKWISDGDYRKFVEPYTGLVRLKSIRKSLPGQELKAPKTFSVLPAKSGQVPLDKKGKEAFTIQGCLCSLLVEQNIPYARQQALIRKREPILRLLWILAKMGTINNKKDSLEIDSETLTSQKIQGLYTFLPDYLELLRPHGVQGEIIRLSKEGWLTPSGALRKKGWFLRIQINASPGDVSGLQQFQRYAKRLQARYKNKAFSKFRLAAT